MALDFVSSCNTTAANKLGQFRAIVAHRHPDPFDQDFFEYRFKNPYFGYVEVENDSCSPFYMFSNNDDLVAQHYFWYGRNGYERASVREWISRAKRAKIVYDVGAHTGLFSLLACRSNLEIEQVVAFEPTARAHSRIMENLIVNALIGKVTVEQMAISDTAGALSLMHYDDAYQIGTGASLLGTEKAMDVTRRESCQTIALDDYIAQSGLWPDLMKVDVEGAEILVMRGADKLLSSNQVTIFIEVLPSTAKDVVNSLENYDISIIDDENNRLIPYAFDRVEHFTNLLAVPVAQRL